MVKDKKTQVEAAAGLRTSWRLAWIVGAIAIVYVGWTLLAGRLPGMPFTLPRNADGHFVRTATNGGDRALYLPTRLDVANIDAKNSISSSHSTLHAVNAGFPCRRVAIKNYSDHPLLEKLGRSLLENFSELAFIEEVGYFSADSPLPTGSRSPDVWVTLEMDHLKMSGMLPRLKVEAEVTVTAGSTMAQGRYGLRDATSPPIVENYWQGMVEHESTTFGVSTDKYSLIGENIAAALAKQLTDHLQELYDKFGPSPTFHAAFYPEYVPTPALISFDAWDAELLASSHGLMFKNETFWRVMFTDSISESLRDAQRRFQPDGWKTCHFNEGEGQEHLSMTRDEDRLDIFVARNDRPTSRVTIRSDDGASDPEPRMVFVHYADRLSRAELQAAADRQLEQGGPLETLLALTNVLRDEQRARYVEMLESQYPNSPVAWRTLAAEYSNMKRQDEARSALRRAYWLAKFDPAMNHQLTATTALAKKLKMEELLKEEVSVELIREFGITELVVGETTAAVEVGLNEPAFFFAVDGSGGWHVLNWRIRPFGDHPSAPRYKIAFARLTNGSSSWGSGTQLPTDKATVESVTLPNIGTVTLKIEQVANDRFRFVGRIEPN